MKLTKSYLKKLIHEVIKEEDDDENVFVPRNIEDRKKQKEQMIRRLQGELGKITNRKLNAGEAFDKMIELYQNHDVWEEAENQGIDYPYGGGRLEEFLGSLGYKLSKTEVYDRIDEIPFWLTNIFYNNTGHNFLPKLDLINIALDQIPKNRNFAEELVYQPEISDKVPQIKKALINIGLDPDIY